MTHDPYKDPEKKPLGSSDPIYDRRLDRSYGSTGPILVALALVIAFIVGFAFLGDNDQTASVEPTTPPATTAPATPEAQPPQPSTEQPSTEQPATAPSTGTSVN